MPPVVGSTLPILTAWSAIAVDAAASGGSQCDGDQGFAAHADSASLSTALRRIHYSAGGRGSHAH